MTLSPEEQILRDVELECPYNSITSMFLNEGETVSPKFGGPCTLSAAMIAERLKSTIRDINITFHNDAGLDYDGHVVVQSDDGEHRKLFDASFLLETPLLVNDADSTSVEHPYSEVRVLPVVQERSRIAQMRMQIPGSDIKIGFVSLLDENRGMIMTRMFNLMQPIVLPDMPIPFHPHVAQERRDQLVLHVLESDLSKSEVTMNTVDGAIQAGKVGHGLKKVNPHQKNKFQNELSRIARLIGVEKKALVEFFHEGWNIYQKLHPDFAHPSKGAFS